MGWVQAQQATSPLFPKRTLYLVKDMLASSQITLYAKSFKHNQYIYPCHLCNLHTQTFVGTVQHECLLGEPLLSVFQTPQGKGQGPSTAAGSEVRAAILPPVSCGVDPPVIGDQCFARGWILCTLFSCYR